MFSIPMATISKCSSTPAKKPNCPPSPHKSIGRSKAATQAAHPDREAPLQRRAGKSGLGGPELRLLDGCMELVFRDLDSPLHSLARTIHIPATDRLEDGTVQLQKLFEPMAPHGQPQADGERHLDHAAERAEQFVVARL